MTTTTMNSPNDDTITKTFTNETTRTTTTHNKVECNNNTTTSWNHNNHSIDLETVKKMVDEQIHNMTEYIHNGYKTIHPGHILLLGSLPLCYKAYRGYKRPLLDQIVTNVLQKEYQHHVPIPLVSVAQVSQPQTQSQTPLSVATSSLLSNFKPNKSVVSSLPQHPHTIPNHTNIVSTTATATNTTSTLSSSSSTTTITSSTTTASTIQTPTTQPLDSSSSSTTTSTTIPTHLENVDDNVRMIVGTAIASRALGIATYGICGFFGLSLSFLFYVNDWDSTETAVKHLKKMGKSIRKSIDTLLNISNRYDEDHPEYIQLSKLTEEEQYEYIMKTYFPNEVWDSNNNNNNNSSSTSSNDDDGSSSSSSGGVAIPKCS